MYVCCRYVYQKSHVEFFASPEAYAALQPKLKAAASLTYMAAKATGAVDTNLSEGAANAISWGCFPGNTTLILAGIHHTYVRDGLLIAVG